MIPIIESEITLLSILSLKAIKFYWQNRLHISGKTKS
jgi:hypothetical protein